jgi:hypothetical protein
MNEYLVDCPRCGAPAETIPWHESSSAYRAGSSRHQCVLGHWSLAVS